MAMCQCALHFFAPRRTSAAWIPTTERPTLKAASTGWDSLVRYARLNTRKGGEMSKKGR